MKKAKKKGTPRAKKPSGRRKAPSKKPFRLEVGKTYATKKGHRAKVLLEEGNSLPMRVEWLTGPKAGKTFWQEPDGVFWNESERGPDLNLIREVPPPKSPKGRGK